MRMGAILYSVQTPLKKQTKNMLSRGLNKEY